MDQVIISFILLVLAAKAEAQAQGNLTSAKRGKRFERKRAVAKLRASH
jgi:hypothetical protein